MENAGVVARPEGALGDLLDTFPVSAGAFVVTLYGDVVAPRGGEVWMGNIIESLRRRRHRREPGPHRRQPAGRRRADRGQPSSGRRSYYRLTPAAERSSRRPPG